VPAAARRAKVRIRDHITIKSNTLIIRWSVVSPLVHTSLFSCLCRPKQVMVWDDHDLWDGYGSYDKPIQECKVFQVGQGGSGRAYPRLCICFSTALKQQ
jgi:hypothetical protein